MLLTLRNWVRVPVGSEVSGMGSRVVLRRIIVVRILGGEVGCAISDLEAM